MKSFKKTLLKALLGYVKQFFWIKKSLNR